MTPCGAAYHINEGNLHGSELAEGEEHDVGLMVDSNVKKVTLSITLIGQT